MVLYTACDGGILDERVHYCFKEAFFPIPFHIQHNTLMKGLIKSVCYLK